MYFRILGPLDVVGPRHKVSVTARRPQIVLAILLLNANRPVSLDQLVDAVWEDAPPRTARAQIQICVSGLRRTLTGAGLADRLQTRAPGYLIQLHDDELDLQLFDRLTAEGRDALGRRDPAGAVTALREALALWRGEPLTGIDSAAVRARVVRLTERRLAAAEECFEAELRLGRHHEVIGELKELVTEHPYRERLRGQLMLALYRAGRQTEALDEYREAKRALVDNLGLEPGARLNWLEYAILTGDPRLNRTAEEPTDQGGIPEPPPDPAPPDPAGGDRVVPRMLPADIPDFTGREQLLQELVDELRTESRHAGAVRVLMVTGRGGIGKTALAVRLGHLMVGSFPDGQLHASLGDGVEPGQVLERFLVALGVARSAIPDDLEERAALYRSRLADKRMLVFLDNVTTECQLRLLLPGTASCAVVGTSRLRLTGNPGTRLVELDVLDAAKATELLGVLVGSERVAAEPSHALELVEQCGRLPLALRVVAARLAARPHWTIARLSHRLADEKGRLDELAHGDMDVRASISVTYEGLPPPAQRLLRRLGILESDHFAAWVAAPLLELDVADAEDHLDVLVDAQLVDTAPAWGPVKRYRLHDLVRIYARERLLADEPGHEHAAAVRRLLGAWLALVTEAHRREYGGHHTVIHSDAAHWELPSALVDTLLADPVAWYESERAALVAAVHQAAKAGETAYCWDIALTTVTLFETRNYFDDWRSANEAAGLAARKASDRRGEASILYSQGTLSMYGHAYDEARVRLELALQVFTEVGELHGRALALRNLAFVDRTVGCPDRAGERFDEALGLLRAAGDKPGEAHVLNNLAQLALERGEVEYAGRLLDDALHVASAADCRRVVAQVLHRIGEVDLSKGATEAAERTFSEVLRMVRERGDQIGEAYALYGLGSAMSARCEWSQAEMTLTHAYTMACQTGERLLTGRTCVALAAVCKGRGGYAQAEEWILRGVDLFDQLRASRLRDQAGELLTEMRREAGALSD